MTRIRPLIQIAMLWCFAAVAVACSGSDERPSDDGFGDTAADVSDGDAGGTDGGTDFDADAGTDDVDAPDTSADTPGPDQDVSLPDADADAGADAGADADSDADAELPDTDGGSDADLPDTDTGSDADLPDTDGGSDADFPDADTGPDADTDVDADPGPFCGDGALDDGEQCDDGNTDDGDGCDASCVVECEDGFENLDGTCVDIDECELALDDCDELVDCTNTPGAFTCGPCPEGYDDTLGDGTQCDDIDECGLALDDCDPLAGCLNEPGAFACGACPEGYVDALGDGTQCDDVDECEVDLGGCDPLAGCVNEPGTFACGDCPAGYDDVAGDGTTCANIDECTLELDDCDALVTCDDVDGAWLCGECPLGYADVFGDGTQCDSLFEAPPEGAPQCYLWGTTHMRTFDGLAYDLQGAGEWRMAFVPDDPRFEVQVRQEPLVDNPYASQITQVAIRDGENVVRIGLDDVDPVSVDGAPAVVPPEGLALAEASLHDVGGTWVVAYPWGAQVRVTRAAGHLDVEVYPADEQLGALRGLCADAAGDPAFDVLLPDGSSLLPPVDVQVLYSDFVHGWAVDDTTSLLGYADGEDPSTFFDAAHPIDYIEAADLADEDRALYEPLCLAAELGHPFLVEACILDAYYGDIDVAIAGAERVQDPELILPLDKPLLFARWTQQGPLANGNWTTTADFTQVFQSINGDPTMFVSPNSYINVLIEGTIAVETTGDDDLVGFVFGMRSPIRENGDDDRVFDTYLLDWKQANQNFGGRDCFEGFALSYVNGDFSAGWSSFWARVTEEGFTSLATLYDTTRGWQDNFVNEFRLLHTPHRVDIWMNGELVFRELGDFQSGRFGFYNYSQPNVRYANFRVTEVDAFTLCGDGVLDPGEACDDGNADAGDGCDAGCAVE